MTSSPVTAVIEAAHVAQLQNSLTGVGIDLVDVGVFRQLLSANDAFVTASFSDAELSSTSRSPERLAARWAAKEAIMKAIKCGIGDLDPLEIEITNLDSGAPIIVLSGNAEIAAIDVGAVGFHLSLSHEDGWAVAIVIARTSESTDNQDLRGSDGNG